LRAEVNAVKRLCMLLVNMW